MKKKRLLSYLLTGFIIAGAVSNLPGTTFPVRAAGRYGYLPRTLSDTELKWSLKVNRNYNKDDWSTFINNPTQAVELNGYVYIVSGGYLYKIKEGSLSKEADPESVESVSGVENGYNVFLSEGKSNGRDVLLVQNCAMSYSSVSAYFADDLKKAWECDDVTAGSYGNSPLTYYDGYIYGNNGSDDFALNADSGSLVWKNTDTNPHTDYSAISNTAPAAVGNFVIYGDNGGYLKVYSAGADEDGEVNSQTKESENRIYSSIKYNNGYLYYLTCTYGKAPELHKTKFDEADGTLGVDSKVNINAVYTTSSPEIKDGKIYISGQKDKNDGSIFVYDENSLDLLASADTKGTGKLYDIKAVTDPADKDNTLIYTASYNQPGSVISSSFKDNKLTDAVSYQDLTKGLADQCSDAQVTVGSDGTVYYSNDSGVLTALAAKTETKAAEENQGEESSDNTGKTSSNNNGKQEVTVPKADTSVNTATNASDAERAAVNADPDKLVVVEATKDHDGGVKAAPSVVEQEVKAVADAVSKAKSKKATVRIDMNGANIIPAEVLKEAKGKDVDVIFNMGDYSWIVNGRNVDNIALKDINLAVDMNTNAIPSDVVKALSGSKPTQQISLRHNGNFGFKATLEMKAPVSEAGKYGNLYWYNSNKKLVFQDSALVKADGTIRLNFLHASDYVIVFGDNMATKSPKTGANINKNAILIMALMLTLAAASGICGMTELRGANRKHF